MAYNEDLYLRKGEDLVTLRGIGDAVVPTVAEYGSAVLGHLLDASERASLQSVLTDLDWITSPSDPDESCHRAREVSLRETLLNLRVRREGWSGGDRFVVATADEAVTVGDRSERERLEIVRFFVSRLDWFRLQAYGALYHLPDAEIALAGDLPMCLPDLAAPVGKAADSENRFTVLRRTGSEWQIETQSLVGAVPPCPTVTTWGSRLSAVAVREDDVRPLLADGERTLWCAVGDFALPNLQYAPPPGGTCRVSRWCVGIDWDRGDALTKAAAEGVERFALGDVDADELVRAPARSLGGSYLDPTCVAAYTEAQKRRHRLREFDEAEDDWWVRGLRGDESEVWLPAALVFSPFAGNAPWLASGFSSSNGAAAYFTERGAMLAAWLELVERDAFLRTYLSGRPPLREPRDLLHPDELRLHEYAASLCDEFDLLVLESSLGTPVVAACGWSDGRLCIGAAAVRQGRSAEEKALTEVLVQLTAPFDDLRPEVEDVRTPEDHGRLYASVGMSSSLLWLLDGSACAAGPPAPDYRSLLRDAYWYVRNVGDWWVAKALDPRLVTLTFGFDNELLGHPAARKVLREDWQNGRPLVPHPFA